MPACRLKRDRVREDGFGVMREGLAPPLQRQSAAGTALATDARTVASDEWRVARRRRRTDGGVGVVDGRRELAGSEGVEGAETGVELGCGQATLAVEPAEKIGGGTLALERMAFEA